ncbi:MAG: methyltransferase domain-containing protein [Mycobacteriales bacterium]
MANNCWLNTAESLPVDDDYVDVVTAMLSPRQAKEISRVLKPGGVAISKQNSHPGSDR